MMGELGRHDGSRMNPVLVGGGRNLKAHQLTAWPATLEVRPFLPEEPSQGSCGVGVGCSCPSLLPMSDRARGWHSRCH